ncbi:MAG: polysaccharide deacetylase family protein [Candidatus Sumerlaeota bacterium]
MILDRDTAVFMYHGLDPGDGRYADLDAGARSYVLSAEHFFAHLQAFARSDRPLVLPRRWTGRTDSTEAGLREGIAPHVVLTFDDGMASDYEVAFPALVETRWEALFFITTDWVGKEGYLDWSQIQEMHAAGMAFGSHGRSHAFLSDLDTEGIREELADSRKELEDRLQAPVRTLSLPGGRHDRRVLQCAADANYEALFTSSPDLPTSDMGLEIYGRIALRDNWDEARMVHFLVNQKELLPRMRRAYLAKKIIQKMLGNRLYARLHHLFWKRKS